MTRKMLQFTHLHQRMPGKRPATLRRGDFAEISESFSATAAGEQSSRCEQCGIPFCSLHCPLGNNIPDWLMLVAQGRMDEAYAVSAAVRPAAPLPP